MTGSWRWLEHTADVGLEAEAEGLPALFATVAEATLALLLERPPSGGRGRRRVLLSAPDLEGLLVRWVDEILFLVQTRAFVPARCSVRLEGPGPEGGWRLEARLAGSRLDRVAMGFRGEVKAATRHRLSVARETTAGGRWRARLFLDV
ncbi:MAG: archease [Bacillota bacterium]|nr:archease [Bacillota bacterium]